MVEPMTPHLPMTGDVLLAFTTPIFARHWPDSGAMNAALRELILTKERAGPGMAKSNFGGWHSEEDLFEWDHPAVAELHRRVVEATHTVTSRACGDALKGLQAEMGVTGWANVSRDGAYNGIHTHPECTWSGSYYVSLGERQAGIPANGVIEFLDPRMAVDWAQLPGQPFGSHLQVNPEAGTMLVFPSWLQHWVHPFHGSGERISIAFNVRLRFHPAGIPPKTA